MNSKKDESRPEYPDDLIKSGVRGKYAKRHRDEGTNLVLMDADLQSSSPILKLSIRRSETMSSSANGRQPSN